MYGLRKTARRRDGRRRREGESPPAKHVIGIIVCHRCYTVLEIDFSQRPTIDELLAAKVETLENHHCRDAAAAALGAGA